MKKKITTIITMIVMAVALIPTTSMADTEKTLPNAEVKALGNISVTEYSVFDGGLSDGTGTMDLQVAMQFVANDSVEEATQNEYGEYTTDFYITIKGLSGDSFVADGCYIAGNYDPFGWIKIPLDGMEIENNKIYPVITSYDFDFSYIDICDSVQNFMCGIFLSEEVLSANPDIKVQLELGLSENLDKAKAADFITVEEPFIYDADDLYGYVAQVGDDKYTSLQEAINNADGKTVKVINDVKTDETFNVAEDKNVTIDLNGHSITGVPAEEKEYSVIKNNGELVIEGEGSILCEHKLQGNTGYAVNTITNCGKLTVKKAIIENKSTASSQIGYAIDNNSTVRDADLLIEGGEVKASGSNYYDGIRQFCNSETNENNVSIEGGEISSIWMQNPSDNSEVRNTREAKGSVSITGGIVEGLYLEPSTGFDATVSGGEIDKVAYFEESEGRNLEKFITGGIFKLKPEDNFVADNYELVENSDGTYKVSEVDLKVLSLVADFESYKLFSGKPLTVTGSGEFADFVKVLMDGKTIDSENYTVKEGSTILTFASAYLDTLDPGKHTIEVVWTTGSASEEILIERVSGYFVPVLNSYRTIIYGEKIGNFFDLEKITYNGEICGYIYMMPFRGIYIDENNIRGLANGLTVLDVGTYKITGEQTGSFETSTFAFDEMRLTVVKRTLDKDDFIVTAKDKQYDGSKEAKMEVTVNDSALAADIAAGKIKVDISGEFENAEVGENKNVNYTINLSGSGLGNYEVLSDGIIGSTTATIVSPSTTVTTPSSDDEAAEDTVDTGDNMNVVIPFAIAALALAAMGTVVATRRRHN